MKTKEQLATADNLHHVDRSAEPTTTSDWNYFITQLITSGRISLSEGVAFYESE